MSKFNITFDAGKPYDETAESEEELKTKLKDFYEKNKDDESGWFDAQVFDEKGEEITERKDITEMVEEIIEEASQ